ncbi:MAG: response regulator [Pseudomonas sp.]
MKIVIVEDDPWIAELLRQVIGSLAPQAELNLFSQVGRAVNHIKANPLDLLLSDLNLPDASGLEAISAAKRKNPQCPRVLITSSIDRATVLAARQAGITDFIAKPFTVTSLLTRLGPVLDQHNTANPAQLDGLGDIRTFLQQRLQQSLFVPWSRPEDRQAVLALDGNCSKQELVRLARLQPVLLAGLIHQANRNEKPENDFDCLSVEQAINQLGLASSIELAVRLARTGPVLEDPLLREKADQLMQQQTVLAKALTRLAQHQSVDAGPVRSAISLCRLGEMATLCAMQNFINYGQQFDPEELGALLQQFAPEFGNRIKISLKLPFLIRELIGALFKLPQSSLRKDRVIMRIAALETGLDDDPVQLRQLRQWVGLPNT